MELLALPNPYYPRKKAVEYEAFILAMEIILAKTKDEGTLMYKNCLEEFSTTSGFVIFVYKIVNERQPHDPKFRSTMWVKKLVTILNP